MLCEICTDILINNIGFCTTLKQRNPGVDQVASQSFKNYQNKVNSISDKIILIKGDVLFLSTFAKLHVQAGEIKYDHYVYCKMVGEAKTRLCISSHP